MDGYLNVTEITEDVLRVEKLHICLMPVCFPDNVTLKYRKDLKRRWMELLPTLSNVKHLNLKSRIDQAEFEVICNMPNLESLYFWSSTATDINALSKLSRLTSLGLDSFSRLTDVSPILSLPQLEALYICNSYKIENLDIIGRMTRLSVLGLTGEITAPKTLYLPSLQPFSTLQRLEHLDLTCTSVQDNSYDVVLELKQLRKFDLLSKIDKSLVEKIKTHPRLNEGSFLKYNSPGWKENNNYAN